MPRTPRRRPPVEDTAPDTGSAVSVVASAATVNIRRRSARPRDVGQEWQGVAWQFFDTVGELRFGVNWIANAMSRVTLAVEEEMPGGDPKTITEGQPAETLESLFGGEAGQSQMLAALGLHLSVPGEMWLIGEPADDTPDPVTGEPVAIEDHYFTASTEEISERAGRWYYDRGDGKRPLHPESLVIRIWRPHPRRYVYADSSVRAVLPVLREIEQLTKHVAASIDSRLAGAGVLVVPSEMTFAGPPVGEDTLPDEEVDPFLLKLTEVMSLAIEDRESAAALVPVMMKAPGEFISDIRHITFSTPLDAAAMALRQEAIRRLALGLDIPPEVVLGTGDVNHWGAWQIDEAAIKVHIEPMCELVCSALTDEFLRPVLTANGYPGDVTALHVVADTSDLRLRPDRSAQAFDLFDRLELSGAALRRETGFGEEDLPQPSELKAMLLRKLATGAVSPEMAGVAAGMLGIDLGPVGTPEEPPALPAPEVEPAPEVRRDIPDQAAAARALLAAGEVLVLRALERANNRVNRRGKTRRPFTPEACDLALTDAWDHAPRVAALCGVDPDWFVSELDRYTRALLSEGVGHSGEMLARVLDDEAGPCRP